jgi:hypothetical protein
LIFKKIKERYYYNKSIMTTGYLKDNTIKNMIKLDLFDDIPFKYLKDTIDFKTEDYKKHTDCPYSIEVDIEDLECKWKMWSKTQFILTIPYIYEVDEFDGIYWNTKKFKVVKKYKKKSEMCVNINNLTHKEEDDEED